jgi:signal transduction protein with GAF and PtsI domain
MLHGCEPLVIPSVVQGDHRVSFLGNCAITMRTSTQATTDQLLLLQETAKKVNSILDLELLLDEIVGGVAGAFGCSRTVVLLKDDVTNELEMIALRGFSNFHLKGYRFKVGGEGMVGRASTAKMPYTPDVRGHPYYVVSEATTLSEVDIPLISGGKLIGAFNAQSPSLDAFSSEQTELLCAHTFFQP